MESTIRLDEPNIRTLTYYNALLPQYSFIQIISTAYVGSQTVINKQTIHGTPEELRTLIADVIYRSFPKNVELPQPSADDGAAEDFERLQQARANTPEANMELPERKTA